MKSLRKRRRESARKVAEWDSDTITVVTHQAIAVRVPSTRVPLKETQAQANVPYRGRKATPVQNATPSQPIDALQVMSSSSNEVIPVTCCYFCRIRGGAAAFECAFEQGADICSRCIRDKKKKCRPATDTELQDIAARCDYCTRRGFKNCNGGNPCDVCLKHNTALLCRRPLKRRIKRENVPSTTVLADGAGETSTLKRSYRKRRKIEVEASSDDDKEVAYQASKAAAMLKTRTEQDVPSNFDNCSDEAFTHEGLEVDIKSSSRGTFVTDLTDPNVLDMSDLVSDTVRRGSMISRQSSCEQFVTPNEMASCDDVEGIDCDIRPKHTALNHALNCGKDVNEVAEGSNYDSSHESSNNLRRAKSTDATSVTEDDTNQIVLPLRTHKRISFPNTNARPCRNRTRVSYVESFLDAPSDHKPKVEHDNESDACRSITSIEEGVIDEEFVFSDVEKSSNTGHSDPDDANDDVEDAMPIEKARPRPQVGKLTERKGGLTWDWSLPPLNNIEEIYLSMAAKAMQQGIKPALDKLKGRPINVATMCSGTESPLIALEMLSKALSEVGGRTFDIAHHFSAEIDPMKQAYIERNFAPAKLFRDVREFIPDNATTATTAYGATEEVPKDIDIFIGGFVCKDLSTLNSRKKDIKADGETGDTWRAMLSYSKKHRPTIVLIENVQGRIDYWNYIVSEWSAAGYEATWRFCDTKKYYLPQTRLRMYMIAVDRGKFGRHATQAVADWKESMKELERPCSTPFGAFLKDTSSQFSESCIALPPKSEPAWVQCKLKYDRIRSEERLGINRPVTRWSENGTLRPPDHGNLRWYGTRSSREWECIDVAHLQRVRNAYDTRFKMEVWDVSQSIDYYGAPLGIVGCITPNGCDFITNQQSVLTGSQMLRLQGMPNDKLLFARETQRDLQDLAGNAMSTTVIGASLVSALLCGTQFFAVSASTTVKPQWRPSVVPKTTLVLPKTVIKRSSQTTNVSEISMALLTNDAFMSSRLCGCEESKNVCNATVYVCEVCGHTACEQHAGNPAHSYTHEISINERTQTPYDFLKKWRIMFPSRLRFDRFPNPWNLLSTTGADGDLVASFVKLVCVADIASQYFYIGDVERQEGWWSFNYLSSKAILKAKVGRTVEWCLYIKTPNYLSGNDALRKALEQPIARGIATGSLLELKWEFFIPKVTAHIVQIEASIETSSSWRSRQGLPDYRMEKTPTRLRIVSKAHEIKTLLGDYNLQPNCGTACDSMYKKAGSCPGTFLFLDPDLVSHPSEDGFVISNDLERRTYGESRISFALLDPSWRPWNIPTTNIWNVRVTVPGTWAGFSPTLISAPISVDAIVPSKSSLMESFRKCEHALAILDILIKEDLDAKRITELSWVPEGIKRLPDFATWQMSTWIGHTACSCAPTLPSLVWSVNQDGTANARENAKAAASFERALKVRCPVFTVEPSDGTRLTVGLNIASLVHRAQGRLRAGNIRDTAWRLCVDHADAASGRLPKFNLQCNSNNAPFQGELRLQHSLDTAQLQSLAWMKAQECGTSLTITEVEEAIHRELGWRAEARAQSTLTVRGGVLADRPSFGKTVTTIALLQSEFQQHSPNELLKRNAQKNSNAFALQALSATLIVCPPHIAQQWLSELRKFLGPHQFELYNVLLIEDFAQLQRLTMDDFESARVIILSWAVLSEADYISQLAQFAAMPEPATTKGCGFDAWMNKVSEEMPERLSALRSQSLAEFRVITTELLQERLLRPEFQESVPIKMQHGAAYQSYNATHNAPKKPKTSKSKPNTKSKSTVSVVNHVVPLLHLFCFNRIVVDEYHYLLNDKKSENYPAYVGVKSILALNRWVLSGTPALSNFSDVNEIASFLGIKLGRHVFGDGATITPFERRLMDDQTDVQKFLMRTETMSRQWHEARHARAQEFLNLFVRKNKPSLDYIACQEFLQPIELDLAHHAIYLELSQYLNAQKTQLKRPTSKSKANADRIDRLDAILNGSASAEDALLKGALSLHGSGIEALIQTRSSEREETQSNILSILIGFESLTAMDPDVERHYECFKEDTKSLHGLGDDDTIHAIRHLLKVAARDAKRSPQTLSGVHNLKGDKQVKALKTEISKLRELARSLVLKMRSLRFIKAIKMVAPALSPVQETQISMCDSAQCTGISSVHQLRLITECGHLACDNCLILRDNNEICVHPTCSARVTVADVIKITDLGTPTEQPANHSFGNKLVAIADLVKKTPKEDQCIIFVPNLETIGTVEEVLRHFDISFHALGRNKKSAARLVEDFKSNQDPKKRKKVLLLNLGSESAAGTNLTKANHIIFACPLLTKSQYEFDSAIAQAIARCLRYGQKKAVHIHHVAALHTIDVNILEHRHRRKNGISIPGSKIRMPDVKLDKKQRTKMIRGEEDSLALVPVSWLEDERVKKVLGVGEELESFASLINFSETFREDED